MSDTTILRLFREFDEEFGHDSGSVNFGGVSAPFPDAKLESAIEEAASETISRMDIVSRAGKFGLKFRRGIGTNAQNIEEGRQASPYFDDVALEVRDAQPPATPTEAISCLSFVRGRLVVVPGGGPALVNPNQAVEVLQAELSKLAEIFRGMTVGLDQRRAELDTQHIARMKELDALAAERQAAFESERAETMAELQGEREDLREERQRLDDRDHMHVRRGLREAITKDIQKRLETAIVPLRTSALRWGVFALSLIAAVSLGYLAWLSLTEFSTLAAAAAEALPTHAVSDATATNAELFRQGEGWVLLGRGALATFAALGFATYAISWLRRVYYDDVRVQRELERYSIDLNRASWAIETIMESKRLGDVALPDALIAGVTKNLFDLPEARGGHGAESDALATILRSSAKAKIGPAGAEFELNGRGAKRVAGKLDEVE